MRYRAPAALLLASLLAVPLLGACGTAPTASGDDVLVGTGEVMTDVRELGPFTRVSVAAGLKVTIGEADAQQVTVQAQANLLPAIQTVVRDGQLIVTVTSPGISTSEPLTLTVRMTAVESVALSAGATGYVEHTGEALNLHVSGGAMLTAIGETGDLRITASSGAHAKLGELIAQDAQVAADDGAAVELTVVRSLTGSADGGATIVLTSKPAQVDVATSSGATVQGG
jgi:hypothetical protein